MELVSDIDPDSNNLRKLTRCRYQKGHQAAIERQTTGKDEL